VEGKETYKKAKGNCEGSSTAQNGEGYATKRKLPR
jgi:hypothetical protein